MMSLCRKVNFKAGGEMAVLKALFEVKVRN